MVMFETERTAETEVIDTETIEIGAMTETETMAGAPPEVTTAGVEAEIVSGMLAQCYRVCVCVCERC